MSSIAASSLGSRGPKRQLMPRRPARSPWAVLRAVVFALYLRELKTRLGGRWGGLLWTLLEPLASTALLLCVYLLFRAHVVAGVDPLLFLVTGLLPFQAFRSLVFRLMEAIDANQGLLSYRQVRPLDPLLARSCVEISISLGLLCLAVGALAWTGHRVMPQSPIELLLASALLLMLGAACGVLAAVATAGAWQRARALVRLSFFPLYLISGAVFPIGALPAAVRELLMLNPLAQLIEALRVAQFGSSYSPPPELDSGWAAFGVLLFLALALAAYRLRRDHLRPL